MLNNRTSSTNHLLSIRGETTIFFFAQTAMSSFVDPSSSLTHSPGVATSPSVRYSLEQLATRTREMVIHIVMYLSVSDITALANTGRAMRDFFGDDLVWSILCRERIVGEKDRIADDPAHLEQLYNILGASSYRQLFCGLHSLSFPLNGWFRLIPSNAELASGGLFRVERPEGHLQFVGIDENGQRDEGALMEFRLQFDAEGNGLEAVALSTGTVYRTTFQSGHLHLNLLTSSFIQNVAKFSPLPPFSPSQTIEMVNDLALVHSSLGLFRAVYGSHGSEILHVSISRRNDASWLQPILSTESEIDFGELQLQGLKITGDPNVPAGQLSFCINLLSTIDVPTAFEADPRLMLMFGGNHLFVTNLRDRQRRIIRWAKGYGQINRYPPLWNPEWVPCDLVFYDSLITEVPSSPERPAQFTIVWQDASETYRHAMDFSPLSFSLDSR